MIGTLCTNLTAARWTYGSDTREFQRRVNPDVNFARRLAVSNCLLNEMTELKILDIVEVIDKFVNFITDGKADIDLTLPMRDRCGRPTDGDLIFLLTQLNDAGRARFKNKIIEVNPIDCTCFAKCTGETGDNKFLEEAFYNTVVPLHMGVRVCGLCRLSYMIENTTSQKPRRCINFNNPAVSSCSLDGCTSFKHIPFYVLNATPSSLTVEYSHRFYFTNSVKMS